MKEAKALMRYQQYGGGRKWLANLVVSLALLLMAADVCIRFRKDIAADERISVIALSVVMFVALLIFKRLTRRKEGGLAQLQLSEQGLVLGDGDSRTEVLWSGFSRILESPNLFVLVNRTKSGVYVLPKRAFPDGRSQEWFRSQANQINSSPAISREALVPARFVSSGGIALALQYKYRDHLSRYITSWRLKGILLGMFALLIVICLIQSINPPADAVNSPLKVLLIVVAIFPPLSVLMFFAISLMWWISEKKYAESHQVVLTGEGIEFSGHDDSGRLPWNTYRYYCENRWSFFVWHPRGSLWLMFPKRAFASPLDLEQCRSLLQTNLKASRWFYL